MTGERIGMNIWWTNYSLPLTTGNAGLGIGLTWRGMPIAMDTKRISRGRMLGGGESG